VFRKLSEQGDHKVVAIASPVGYVGIDVHVHHVINAAGLCLLFVMAGFLFAELDTGGLSPTLTLQKIGRGLRRAADKERLDYHDFLNTTNPYLEGGGASE
jgi:hypothetical protein